MTDVTGPNPDLLAATTAALVPPPEPKSGVLRETPETPDARAALVKKLAEEVAKSRKAYEKTFKRMRADAKFVRTQLANPVADDDRANVNITQRHVKQQVSSLYAKNPTFTAERTKRKEFKLWDGQMKSLQEAMVAMQEAQAMGLPPSPLHQALMTDIVDGLTKRKMLEGVGETLERVMAAALDEQSPPFKGRAKKLVRRVVTQGVGYIKLGYQRQLRKRPDIEAKLADVTDQLANIERMKANQTDGLLQEVDAEAERLRIAQAALENAPEVIVREGLVFDFPASTRIIPDLRTKELTGWVGSHWVAEEFLLSVEEVQSTYGVDISRASYTGYKLGQYGALSKSAADDKLACVWEIYHRLDGVVYVVLDGFPDFLREPAAPDVTVPQFVPIYPLMFNELEDEDELYPPSDIEWIRPIQRELNRKKESLRQHRIAARPFYFGPKGKFEQGDLKDIAGVNAHEIIFTNALDQNEKLDNVIQRFPTVPIDPNLYETSSDINDLQMVVGSQEANIGGTGGATATESAIAEGSRTTSLSSNVDDLDDFLSLVARDAGIILFANMQQESVLRIVGPGAVWPVLSHEDVADEIYLNIEAGSSGRPNKEQELANLERITPLLLQIPGIDPSWMGKTIIKTLDSRIDVEDALASGLPAILTLNRLMQTPAAPAAGGVQPSTGDPATDPNQQGGEGGDNAPNTDTAPGGPQAGMPPPSAAQPNVPAM